MNTHSTERLAWLFAGFILIVLGYVIDAFIISNWVHSFLLIIGSISLLIGIYRLGGLLSVKK